MMATGKGSDASAWQATTIALTWDAALSVPRTVQPTISNWLMDKFIRSLSARAGRPASRGAEQGDTSTNRRSAQFDIVTIVQRSKGRGEVRQFGTF
jgi:hypothetical protein